MEHVWRRSFVEGERARGERVRERERARVISKVFTVLKSMKEKEELSIDHRLPVGGGEEPRTEEDPETEEDPSTEEEGK